MHQNESENVGLHISAFPLLSLIPKFSKVMAGKCAQGLLMKSRNMHIYEIKFYAPK